MTIGYDAALIIVVMAVAVALCRLGGFWAMGFVTITPRIESGLKAIPLAVMIGIMLPPILHGGIAETAGVATTIAGVRLVPR